MSDMSPNAVIARNVRRQRRARGWTQSDLAERLSERDSKRWTVSMVSDAESAAADQDDRGRDRQFTVNEVNVLARVFQVSVLALFVPEPDQLVTIGSGRYTRDDYVDLVLQFPPEATPPGFEHQLQHQYLRRNRDTDRLLWSRPRARPAAAPELLRRFLRSPDANGERSDGDGSH